MARGMLELYRHTVLHFSIFVLNLSVVPLLHVIKANN
uniref:Uncharacterized protein n=1 Tax=Anguilla anguilla TaxID=7936 RepID=A0A0E9VP25_ANGAN